MTAVPKISDRKRKKKEAMEQARKTVAAIPTPIRMIMVKDFQAAEDKFRTYASKHGELPTEVTEFIDKVSRDTFGITADDTTFRFPDEYYSLREEDEKHWQITKQSVEHDAWYRTSSLDIDQTVQFLLSLKLDFRHPDGRPMSVTKLFSRQGEAAMRGKMGKIPDHTVVSVESWSNKLGADVEKWRSMKRKKHFS
ncbi:MULTISPECIES: hypothetical protein [Agrobacterium]|nr:MULTISPECIES: hypothetical protein [Agrobacterium]QCL72260.1 hypothetical protein CFBP5499_01620 [Agrobacterium tumefaciens]